MVALRPRQCWLWRRQDCQLGVTVLQAAGLWDKGLALQVNLTCSPGSFGSMLEEETQGALGEVGVGDAATSEEVGRQAGLRKRAGLHPQLLSTRAPRTTPLPNGAQIWLANYILSSPHLLQPQLLGAGPGGTDLTRPRFWKAPSGVSEVRFELGVSVQAAGAGLWGLWFVEQGQ